MRLAPTKQSTRQCTAPLPTSTALRSPLSVSPRSLAAALARIPAQRRAGSVPDARAAILPLSVAALLSPHLSVLAIAEWGAAVP